MVRINKKEFIPYMESMIAKYTSDIQRLRNKRKHKEHFAMVADKFEAKIKDFQEAIDTLTKKRKRNG